MIVGAATYLFVDRRPQSPLAQSSCPAIADVSRRPLGETDFNGAIARINHDGFHDVFLSAREGQSRVGIREEWAGAVVFLSRGQDNQLAPQGLRLALANDAYPRQGGAKIECPSGPEFSGWSAFQGADKCGHAPGVLGTETTAGLQTIFTPVQYNRGWRRRDCSTTGSICGERSPEHPPIRIAQNLRFVRADALEIEVQITNLGEEDILSRHQTRADLPALFPATSLRHLFNADGEVQTADPRVPAGLTEARFEFVTPEGWAGFSDDNGQESVGLLWENRPAHARALGGDAPELSSDLPLILPAHGTLRARYYVLLGSRADLSAHAQALDRALPPFGAIDVNELRPDARTVDLRGWVLDNKGVEAVELWVDGKKTADLELQTQRDDVCAAYPGYHMCEQTHSRIGFATTYRRPAGTGCERPVEVRARDSDGNWRVIARKSVSPVVYALDN